MFLSTFNSSETLSLQKCLSRVYVGNPGLSPKGGRAMKILKCSILWIVLLVCCIASTRPVNAQTVDELIERLKSGNRDVQNKARQDLVKLGAAAVEPFIRALTDEDEDVRSSAALGLKEIGDIGDKRAVEPLIDALKDSDESVRWYAAEALGEIGDIKAVDSLISALKDRSESVRQSTVIALGDIGDKRAFESILNALNDPSDFVRSSAARALGKIGDERAFEPLVAALKNPSYRVRSNAALGLGYLGDKRAFELLVTALKDRQGTVRESVASALFKLDDKRAVEFLIAALKDSDTNVRRNAVENLGEIADERAVQALIFALMDKNDSVRKTAEDALIRKADKKVIEPVAALLAYKDMDNNNVHTDSVRYAAAKVLGKIPDPRAVRPLLLAIKREKERSVRTFVEERISEALVNIGGTAVVPLIDSLKDEDAGIRVQAALFLGKVKDERRIEPLLSALTNDESIDVRKAAARALIGVSDQRILRPLIKSMQSEENPDVRRCAAIALGTAKDPEATTVLIEAALNDKDKKVQQASKSALLQIKDPRAVEVYIDLLKSENSETRLQAAKFLLDSKDPKAEKVHDEALGIVLNESYLTELVTYDQYGRPDNIFLFDLQGLKVEGQSFQGVPLAKKELTFSQYNSRQITREKIIVFGTGGVAHVIDYDAYGKPKNSMWLCLDDKGNVIKDANGKAFLVRPFQAEQKREYENQYNGAYIKSKITKIYPCKNCAEQTGIKNCRYVW
jgi:HEAT repeat protein